MSYGVSFTYIRYECRVKFPTVLAIFLLGSIISLSLHFLHISTRSCLQSSPVFGVQPDLHQASSLFRLPYLFRPLAIQRMDDVHHLADSHRLRAGHRGPVLPICA